METLLQDLKAKAKHIAVLIGVILVSLFGYHIWKKHAAKVDQNTTSTVLQPNQKEKIIIDPVKHEITIVTRKLNGQENTSKTYFPDRATAIVEDINGKLSIQERKWGPEFRPYFGAGFDGAVRLHLGADGLYINKFDIGGGLKLNPVEMTDTRVDINASYNFYHNTSIAISVDNHKTVEGFIKLRF